MRILVDTIIHLASNLASFPGPTQLSIAFSMEKQFFICTRGEPGDEAILNPGFPFQILSRSFEGKKLFSKLQDKIWNRKSRFKANIHPMALYNIDHFTSAC